MSYTMQRAPFDLIIIGAGIAGLSTAAHLPAQSSLGVLLLEARSRLGGRLHTEDIEGVPIDLGASWIHMIYGNPLARLSERLKLDLLDLDFLSDPAALPSYIDKDGRPIGQVRTQNILATCYSLSFIEAEQRAKEQDPVPASTDSVGEWIMSQARERLDEQDTPYVLQTLRMMSGYEGANAHKLSLRHCGADRGFRGPDRFLASGYHSIVEHLRRQAQKHSSLKVALETPVKSITDDSLQGLVSVETTKGEVFQARRVVVTVPLGVLQARDLSFSPALPERKTLAISRIGFGILNKMVLVYPAHHPTWWEQKNFLMAFFKPREPLPQIASIFAHSFTSKTAHVIVAYISADDSPDFECLDDATITQWGHGAMLDSLVRRKEGQVTEPIRGFGTRWRSDQYARGAYSYIRQAELGHEAEAPSPLDFVELGRSCWEGRLGFAGEATELNHFSYAHGAYLSGKREAERIAMLFEEQEAEGEAEKSRL